MIDPSPPSGDPSIPGRAVTRLSPLRAIWEWLTPVRLLIGCLLVVAGYGIQWLGGLGLESVVVLPMLAVVVDLLFQRVRFRQLRVPEAALATGLFLALLLPPTVPLVAAAGVVVSALAVRHIFRFRGRPWFNPAALGIVLGAVFFGTTPAWWVGLGTNGELLMAALGLLLTLRQPSRWRIPVAFFLAYVSLSVLQHALFGGADTARVLLLSAIDPSVVFFGLYMVVEPRTSPASPAAQPLYGGLVAFGALFLPVILPTIGLLVGLLLGNVLALFVGSPTRSGAPSDAAAPGPSVPRRRAGLPRSASTRWGLGRRAGAAFVLLFVIGAFSLASATPGAPPVVLVSSGSGAGGSGSSTVVGCQQDNPTIPSSTASMLHNKLGPSVLLSYDPSTSVTKFYDPVNQVTVTETDLYEDYGFAEFNGDDYTVQGCAP